MDTWPKDICAVTINANFGTKCQCAEIATAIEHANDDIARI